MDLCCCYCCLIFFHWPALFILRFVFQLEFCFFPCWKTLFCLIQKTINQNNPVTTVVNLWGCRLLLVCTHIGTCTQEEMLSFLLSLLHQTQAISQILIYFPGESTHTNPWTEALLLTFCLYLGSCNYMLPKQQISRQEEGRGQQWGYQQITTRPKLTYALEQVQNWVSPGGTTSHI